MWGCAVTRMRPEDKRASFCFFLAVNASLLSGRHALACGSGMRESHHLWTPAMDGWPWGGQAQPTDPAGSHALCLPKEPSQYPSCGFDGSRAVESMPQTPVFPLGRSAGGLMVGGARRLEDSSRHLWLQGGRDILERLKAWGRAWRPSTSQGGHRRGHILVTQPNLV